MKEKQTKQHKSSSLEQKYRQSMTKMQNMLKVTDAINTAHLAQTQMVKIVLKYECYCYICDLARQTIRNLDITSNADYLHIVLICS